MIRQFVFNWGAAQRFYNKALINNFMLKVLQSILKHQKPKYKDAIKMQSILKYQKLKYWAGAGGGTHSWDCRAEQYLSVIVTATAQMFPILSLTTCINSQHISNIYKYTHPPHVGVLN